MAVTAGSFTDYAARDRPRASADTSRSPGNRRSAPSAYRLVARQGGPACRGLTERGAIWDRSSRLDRTPPPRNRVPPVRSFRRCRRGHRARARGWERRAGTPATLAGPSRGCHGGTAEARYRTSDRDQARRDCPRAPPARLLPPEFQDPVAALATRSAIAAPCSAAG